MRDDPSLDKKTKTKKSKSTTIKEGEELMVMAPDGTTKKKKNAKEVDEVLDQGQRRLALRSVQRTTEDLLLISDALKTKEATLGSLPTRLGKGLEDMQSPETTPGGTLTMETAQTLAMEPDLIQDAKVVSGAGGRDDYLYQQE